ncbi:flagellar basal body rod protein FlgC [Ferrimonas marina]|uniref:Flagellar basal-body rod protein FlgC n=1 Tax=Ferrimonas marina TaxID=299255 RepID=A0A1M5R0K2_9GAMM|nr:flagellar basal body rod protein FlgC [Ferrimonas marina]SHH19636.1 flagellar basal-body rod protein FlgC [Ferrimonas marina]
MSFSEIYTIAGSAMNAQSQRLNTVASNLANVDAAASSEETAYRALKPVFQTIYQQTQTGGVSANVNMAGVVQSDAALEKRYEPDHPMADDTGYVFYSNVNSVQEMADMMAATRAFETSTDVMARVSSMQQNLLKLGGM